MSALLVLGALVDLSASSYRKRGWLLLAAALVLVPLLTLIWCRTQGEYVRQLRIECERASPPIAFPNLVTAGAGASRSMNWEVVLKISFIRGETKTRILSLPLAASDGVASPSKRRSTA